MAITEPTHRGPGRPRNEDSDRQIIAATLRLLGSEGYDRTSIEAVAAEAGVTRATVYRRYPTKADMVTAAVCTLAEAAEPAGSPTRAARSPSSCAASTSRSANDGISIVASLYLQRHEHPEMLDSFRERVIRPCREKFLIALRVGVDRGQVKPDADLELAVDTLIGAYLSRTFTGSSCDDGWAERLVGQVWPGLQA